MLMKTDIPPMVLEQVRREYLAAPGRTQKRAIVEGAAKHFGVSVSTVNRKLDLRLRKRTLSQTERERVEEKNAHGRTVWNFAQAKSADDKTCSIKAAYELLIMTGQLPQTFTRKDCYDAIERMKLKNIELEKTQRFTRFEREHPLSMFQVDFTKSDFIRVLGDDLIMTDGRWSRGEDKRYLWIGVAIDDASRVHYAQYMLSVGEDAFLAQQLLVDVMQQKDALLLQGVPRELYFDRGPGFKTVTQSGLKALGITPIVGDDFAGTRETNKQARGKIEGLIRYIKSDFEQGLHLKYGAKHRFGFGELNELLQEWSEWQNQQVHPTRGETSKWNYFKGALASCTFPPRDALGYFSVIKTGTVDRRMIKTGKNDFWQAPPYMDEGTKVEYSLRQGECYAIWRGEEIKLVPHSTNMKKARPAAIETFTVERETDTFMGPLLRDRFNKELHEITNGELSLRSLSADDYSDIKPFFQDARTLAEIREEASNVKMRVLMPKQFDANTRETPYALPQGHHATIIKAPVYHPA